MDLSEAAARARHDLGRYVALQTRFVGVEGDEADLRDALESDLVHTRRSPGADLGVAEVWAACRGDLAPAGPALLAPVDEVVAALAERAGRLTTLDASGLRATAALALRCADLVKELHQALAAR